MDVKKKKILIADDSQTFLMYIGILLKRMGFTVIPAENGLEVLKLLKLVDPDLIILDVRMPSLDGITVMRYIKEDKQTSNIPILIATVDGTEEMMEKCKTAGCDNYLVKPIKIEKLHEALQECLFSKTGTKRKHLRSAYNKKVVVTHRDEKIELYGETLSEGGIYIRKKDPLPVGTHVEVTLPLKDKYSLTLQGVVIYIKGLFGDIFKVPPGMAIEFRDLKENEAALLKSSVESLIAGDLLETQEDRVLEADKENGGEK